MSVIDIRFRLDEICKKYDKYDIDKQREQNVYGDDAFARFYASVEDELNKAYKSSEMLAIETNRAAAVARSAEIRRLKARLLEELPKLIKLSKRKTKGLSKEDHEARLEIVLSLQERIEAIPEGNAAKQTVEWGASTSNKNIKLDTDGNFDPSYFNQSEESSQFREEYVMRKIKQDEGLDFISEGLGVLKGLAEDMNEELDRQVPLMDEIETKVDQNASALKNNNVRLKKQLTELRSSRNFCIDIILIVVLLGVAAYLYNILQQ